MIWNLEETKERSAEEEEPGSKPLSLESLRIDSVGPPCSGEGHTSKTRWKSTAYGSWIGEEWERMWEGLREGESDQNTLYKLLKKLIKNKGNLVYLIICKTSVFPYLLLKTSHIFYSYIMIIFPPHCSFFIGTKKKKPQERK